MDSFFKVKPLSEAERKKQASENLPALLFFIAVEGPPLPKKADKKRKAVADKKKAAAAAKKKKLGGAFGKKK